MIIFIPFNTDYKFFLEYEGWLEERGLEENRDWEWRGVDLYFYNPEDAVALKMRFGLYE